MRKYLALMRAGIIEMLHFRLAAVVLVLGNLLYLTVIYFLWKAIYASSGTTVVNGMTFEDTLIYLVLATALFNFMEMYVVWDIGRCIQSGKIVLDLIRPMDFKNYKFWEYSGNQVGQFVATFLPTFLIVLIVTKGAIPLGINLLLFAVAVIFAVIINYNIDFIVSTICLYTESIWGINIMKQVVVALLSGATIPLAFFPDSVRKVVDVLPFKAIYDTPLTILLSGTECTAEILMKLAVQVIWVIALGIISRAFWAVSIKQITVNGG